MYAAKAFPRKRGILSTSVSDRSHCESYVRKLFAPMFVGVVVLGALVSSVGDAAESDWRYLGGNSHSNQYSALEQINAKNIGSLGLLWYSDLPIGEGLVGNPLVMESAVYQGGPYGS